MLTCAASALLNHVAVTDRLVGAPKFQNQMDMGSPLRLWASSKMLWVGLWGFPKVQSRPIEAWPFQAACDRSRGTWSEHAMLAGLLNSLFLGMSASLDTNQFEDHRYPP
jgi:hypothetical protein